MKICNNALLLPKFDHFSILMKERYFLQPLIFNQEITYVSLYKLNRFLSDFLGY